MTVQILQLFEPIPLGMDPTVLYTMPNTPSGIVLSGARFRFANTSNVAVAITVNAVPAGGSASDDNNCCPGESIAGNAHLDLDMPRLGASDHYEAFADTDSVITVSVLDGVLFS